MVLLTGLIVVDLLAFWGLWYVIFHDWDDFVKSLHYELTPDIWSLLKGRWVEDLWAENKLLWWVLLCISLVVSEYFVFFH